MALISEFALTPDVLDSRCYSSDDTCRARLDLLRRTLFESGFVRDLRAGEWSRIVRNSGRSCLRGRELVRKLCDQRRLIETKAFLAQPPVDDLEWCEEALAGDRARPLAGVITNCAVASKHVGTPKVASINKLGNAAWSKPGESVRLRRTVAAYIDELQTLLFHANSIMFIDPHVDFGEPRYDGLQEILRMAGGRDTTTLIELHRVCYHGSGRNRIFLDLEMLQGTFRRHLSPIAVDNRLKIDVFIWDDFHDRFLISDIFGISLSNGFDTSRDITEKVTWTRLSREVREDVQREFDPASGRHTLRAIFSFSGENAGMAPEGCKRESVVSPSVCGGKDIGRIPFSD